jgi:hypothetical protein
MPKRNVTRKIRLSAGLAIAAICRGTVAAGVVASSISTRSNNCSCGIRQCLLGLIMETFGGDG